jgi:drug/metabolite transporter (DMT)-like permease
MAAAYLYLVASALLLLPWLLRRRQYRLALHRDNFPVLLFLSLVGICGYNTFFTYGMALTEPETGSLIIAANPAMTTLISRIWKKEHISPLRAVLFL